MGRQRAEQRVRGRLVQPAAPGHLGECEALVGVVGEQFEHGDRPVGPGSRAGHQRASRVRTPARRPRVAPRMARQRRPAHRTRVRRHMVPALSTRLLRSRPRSVAGGRLSHNPAACQLRCAQAFVTLRDARVVSAADAVGSAAMPLDLLVPGCTPGCSARRPRPRQRRGGRRHRRRHLIDTLATPDQYEPFAAEAEALGLPIRRAGADQQRRSSTPGGTGRFKLAAVYGSPQASVHLDQEPNASWGALYPRRRRRVRRRGDPAGEPHRGAPTCSSPRRVTVLTTGGQMAENLVVAVTAAEVLFAGAMCSFGTTPLCWQGDPARWADELDRLVTLAPIVVPGHGPIGGEEEVRDLQAYLRACVAADGDPGRIGAGAVGRLGRPRARRRQRRAGRAAGRRRRRRAPVDAAARRPRLSERPTPVSGRHDLVVLGRLGPPQQPEDVGGQRQADQLKAMPIPPAPGEADQGGRC